VRTIDSKGEQAGVLSTAEALKMIPRKPNFHEQQVNF
jgi:translation initiation factor IF-3